MVKYSAVKQRVCICHDSHQVSDIFVGATQAKKKLTIGEVPHSL